MATKGSGGERTVDDFTLVASLIGGLFVAGWIVWFVARDKITMAYTYLRRLQFWWLDMLGSTGLPGASGVHEWFQKTCAASGLIERCTRDFRNARWSELSGSSMYVNLVLLAVIVGWAARMFVRINATHPNLLYTKVFNVGSFVRVKKRLYRHLRMFDAIDLVAAPLDDPLLGMSQTSRQFAFHHRLIADDWIDEPDGSCTPTIVRAKAEKVFRAQLGKLWTGPGSLSPSETLLLAIAIPRVAATDPALSDDEFKKCVKESDQMIDWCWDQFKPTKPEVKSKDGDGKAASNPLAWLQPENIDLKHPRAVIDRYVNTAPMQLILSRHAYVRTILYAMFVSARSLGVLPPADMRWLRFYDRSLWYVLQNFGRQGVYAEGAAPAVHYLYEVKSREPLAEPQVDKAINALEIAVNAFKYKPSDRDKYRKGVASIKEAIPEELLELKDK